MVLRLLNSFSTRASKRILAALAVACVLVVAAALVASLSYDKSREYTSAARSDRANSLVASAAVGSFWREREATNEYLLLPTAGAAAEVRVMQARFERRLLQVSSESAAEHADVLRARTENERLLALLPRRSVALDAQAVRLAVKRMNALEASVTDPLNTLVQVNEQRYRNREMVGQAATRRSLEIGAASGLLSLIALGWFAAMAIRLVGRVERQNVELLGIDQSKDDFISTISHELRTPITSIQGYTELLLDEGGDPLTGEQRAFLATVQRSSGRLLALVNDLLLIAQARAGRLEMHKSRCDLAEVARLSLETAQATASKQGVLITLNAPDSVFVEADPTRLGQAVDNLVSNAVKFTPAGGTVQISVSVAPNDRVTIVVSDTGLGMTAAEVDRMFERFFRTAAARTGQVPGTGLGLAITKVIVEAHAGTITLASEPNVGTAFEISLPTASYQEAARLSRLVPNGASAVPIR